MTDVPFHATRMGQRFYEGTMPKLAEELARVNASLAELINVLDRVAAPGRPDDTEIQTPTQS